MRLLLMKLAARSASQFRLQCVWIRSLDVQIDVALRFYELLSTFEWALQSVGRYTKIHTKIHAAAPTRVDTGSFITGPSLLPGRSPESIQRD